MLVKNGLPTVYIKYIFHKKCSVIQLAILQRNREEEKECKKTKLFKITIAYFYLFSATKYFKIETIREQPNSTFANTNLSSQYTIENILEQKRKKYKKVKKQILVYFDSNFF